MVGLDAFAAYLTHPPSFVTLQAYELSTLTGTQVLLLVVSETGLVYTFTTAKLQPLVTQAEGKNLIQACLNAPQSNMPPAMPVGAPMSRPGVPGSMTMPGGSSTANLPGGLSIPGAPVGGPQGPTKEDGDDDDEEVARGGRTASTGDKRRRRPSTTGAPSTGGGRGGPGSPQTPNSNIPPPLSIPGGTAHGGGGQPTPGQIALGSPTSPQQQHSQVPSSPQYGPAGGGGYGSHGSHHGHHAGSPPDPGLYSGHMMPPPGYAYAGGPGGPGGQGGQPLGGLAAAAAAQHNHWAQSPVGQGGHYGRR